MLDSVVATGSIVATSAIVASPSVEPTSIASLITTVVPNMIASALPSAVTTTAPVASGSVSIPSGYSLISAFAGGLAGATRAHERRMDISGIAVLAIVNALGGGIMRDVLLQDQGIAAFTHWTLLAAALTAAAFGFFFSSLYHRMKRPFLYLDALSLGLFAVVGADKALAAGLSFIPAVLLGIVTSVGGGMIRDVLCNETPQIMRPGTLSASAAALGSLIFVFLVTWANFVKPVAAVIAVSATLSLRLIAVKRGWQAPVPANFTTDSRRPGKLVRERPADQ